MIPFIGGLNGREMGIFGSYVKGVRKYLAIKRTRRAGFSVYYTSKPFKKEFSPLILAKMPPIYAFLQVTWHLSIKFSK